MSCKDRMTCRRLDTLMGARPDSARSRAILVVCGPRRKSARRGQNGRAHCPLSPGRKKATSCRRTCGLRSSRCRAPPSSWSWFLGRVQRGSACQAGRRCFATAVTSGRVFLQRSRGIHVASRVGGSKNGGGAWTVEFGHGQSDSESWTVDRGPWAVLTVDRGRQWAVR